MNSLPKKNRDNISSITLIFFNLIPLYGVLFLGWDQFSIILLYWAENLIIGIFTIAKMSVVGHFPRILPPILFFIVHYGGFMFGHLIAIITLFGPRSGNFFFGGNMFSYFALIKISIFALFIQHAISFITNFIGKKEYIGMKPTDLFFSGVYNRIVIVHVTILFGAFLGFLIPGAAGILVMVVLKILVDLWAHRREHWRIALKKSNTLSGEQEVRRESPRDILENMKKIVVIIILVLIGGGIFAYTKLMPEQNSQSTNNEITFTTPTGFTSSRSVITTEKSGVSKDGIIVYEFVYDRTSAFVINKYLDKELFDRSTDSLKLDKKYTLTNATYHIADTDAKLYAGKDAAWADQLIVVPSQMVTITINPFNMVGDSQAQIDAIIGSIKF